MNRTLAEALSENVVTTTAHMRDMVQQDADALGLGVEVLGFTVGGMHPPVPVASDYQAVVSAELGKVTAVVNAQAVRNRTVPARRELPSWSSENNARAEGAEALAKAAGEAWSFLHVGVAVSAPRQRNTSSAAVWRRSRRASRVAASRSWMPAFSGMEVSCG